MQPPDDKTPEEAISDKIAQKLFGAGPDPAERTVAARRLLLWAVIYAVLLPALFYLRFGEVDGLGWGTTIFFVVYCLLAAAGLYFGPRREFHTPVRLRGDWLDRIGAFWLVACVFGPFFGYVVTAIFPLTPASWRWVYGVRFFLGGGLPAITCLPLVRYMRGKVILVGLPILVIVTMLAIWSVANVGRDLWAGPLVSHLPSSGQAVLYLQYTDQILQ